MPQAPTPGDRSTPDDAPVGTRASVRRTRVLTAAVVTLSLAAVAATASSRPAHEAAPRAAASHAAAMTGATNPPSPAAEPAAEPPAVATAQGTTAGATTEAGTTTAATTAPATSPTTAATTATTAATTDQPSPVVAGAEAGAQVALAAGTTTAAPAGGTGDTRTPCGAATVVACQATGAAGTGSVGATGAGALAPVSASTPGGVPMPAGNLPGWTQVFADDFSTPAPLGTFTSSAYGQRWFPYGPYKDTSGRGTYDASKTVSVANGVLDINVHTENGTHYVAALVPHQPKAWGQAYGRYSFRFRADTLPGYKMVAILWPDSDNWGEGEIDFPEVTHLVTNEKMYGNVYQKGSTATYQPGPATRFTSTAPANASGWHTATLEWLPGSVTMWLDDAKLGTFTQNVPDTKFHLVFQIETNLYDAPPADSVSGHVQLDWVTFYQRS